MLDLKLNAKAIAESNTILRGEVGSVAHGTGLDGQEDTDHMGVCIEPPESLVGLNEFSHYTFRTAADGARSMHGDLDLTIYSLRKYCYLAYKGNPSILMLMWLPSYTVKEALGVQLIQHRDSFVSKDAGERYLAYLTAQRNGMTGVKSPKVARPELVAQFGFDTKYAMHSLRLGLQGIEYLTYRRISIPVPQYEREFLLKVRSGQVKMEDCITQIDIVSERLQVAINRCTFTADLDKINKFLIEAHQRHWKMKGMI